MIEPNEDLFDKCNDCISETMLCQLLNWSGILNIIGVQLEFSPRVIVMESTQCSLSATLHTDSAPVTPLRQKLIDCYELKVSLLIDIAATMQYLHSLGFVFRNLSAENVLLDDSLKPKLTNLQLDSQPLEKSKYTAYFAPEVFLDGDFSKSSDVFAFAVLMNEILSCEKPFGDLSSLDIMRVVTKANQKYDSRPKMFSSTDCSADFTVDEKGEIVFFNLTTLIQNMWHENSLHRPNFQSILKSLENIGTDTQKKAVIVLESEHGSVSSTEKSVGKKNPISPIIKGDETEPEGIDTLTTANLLDMAIGSEETWVELDEKRPVDEAVLATDSDSSSTVSEEATNEMDEEIDNSNVRIARRKAVELPPVALPWNVLLERLKEALSRMIGRLPISDDEVADTVLKLQEAVIKDPTLRGNLRDNGAGKIITALMNHSDVFLHPPSSNLDDNKGIKLLERGLWFASILGTHHRHNREELVESGIFLVMTKIWKVFRGNCISLLVAVLLSLETLLVDNPSADLFAEKHDGSKMLFDILQSYGIENENVCEHCFASITHLCKHHSASKKALEDLGICRCIAVSLIKYSDGTDFYVTDACLAAISALCASKEIGSKSSRPAGQPKHGWEEPVSIHSITEKLGDLGVADHVFKSLCKAKSLNKLSVMETSLAALADMSRGNSDNQLRFIRAGAVQVMLELLSVRGHVAVENTLLCELVLEGLSILTTQEEAAVLLSGRAVTKLQVEQNFADLFRNIIQNLDDHVAASAIVADRGLLFLKLLINHKKDRWAKVGQLGGCKLLTDIMKKWLAPSKEKRDDELIPVGLYERCLATAKGFGLSNLANMNLLMERKVDILIVSVLELQGFHSEAAIQTGLEVITMLVAHYQQLKNDPREPSVQIQMSVIVLQLLSKFAKLRTELAIQISQPMKLLCSQSSNKPIFSSSTAARCFADILNTHLLSEKVKMLLQQEVTPPQTMKNILTLAELGLACIGNLAENNNDIANISASGLCEIVAETFRLYGRENESIALEGLRAISNLAVSNQKRFAAIDVCAIIFDVTHFFYSKSKSENNLLCSFVCKAVFNLSLHNTENKIRFIDLHIPAELRTILRIRTLSEDIRKEIKDTINFLHY